MKRLHAAGAAVLILVALCVSIWIWHHRAEELRQLDEARAKEARARWEKKRELELLLITRPGDLPTTGTRKRSCVLPHFLVNPKTVLRPPDEIPER